MEQTSPVAIPLYIFDIDGTIADIQHRVHYLRGNDSKKWDRFYAEAKHDSPKREVIKVLDTLRLAISDIYFFTGRPERLRGETERWIKRHTEYNRYPRLFMRPDGDHQPDFKLKSEWLDELTDMDRDRLVAVFEDRNQVVDMYRERGITCFQVAPGDF